MFTLTKAKMIAEGIVQQLQPHCEVINIAGSIRREKIEVKDIEIVCVPKRVKIGSMDLFGEDTRKTIVAPEFVRLVSGLGRIIKGKPDGRMMNIELPQKIQLDLFMPQPIDYFRQYVIRTGSKEYSQNIIANGWVKKGWVGTEDGLRLRTECRGIEQKMFDKAGVPYTKMKWVCENDNPTLPPVWDSERAFLSWLDVTILHPKYRNI